jgi:hypothetical protein
MCSTGSMSTADVQQGFNLGTLVPLPALKTHCGHGVGMAVCPTLGLLVTSNDRDNTLSVFALPSGGIGGGVQVHAGAGLEHVCTLGGASSAAPMQFKFLSTRPGHGYSGWMAFTGPATSRLLLVTDAGHDAVHIIDVAGQVHVGHVASPGIIVGPRGVAARGCLVAISAWRNGGSGEHVVRVFEGSEISWTQVRVVAGGFGTPGSADGQLQCPNGLQFTGDGTGLAVVDFVNDRVSLFRVEDGSFVRHVATGLKYPWDVEECEGGWLVACSSTGTIEFASTCVGSTTPGGVGHTGRAGVGGIGNHPNKMFSIPSALALVPSQCLVVREAGNGGQLQFFATPDAVAMASMSAARVGWMSAVVRGIARSA